MFIKKLFFQVFIFLLLIVLLGIDIYVFIKFIPYGILIAYKILNIFGIDSSVISEWLLDLFCTIIFLLETLFLLVVLIILLNVIIGYLAKVYKKQFSPHAHDDSSTSLLGVQFGNDNSKCPNSGSDE